MRRRLGLVEIVIYTYDFRFLGFSHLNCVTMPILQMRKSRLRERKRRAQSHTYTENVELGLRLRAV